MRTGDAAIDHFEADQAARDAVSPLIDQRIATDKITLFQLHEPIQACFKRGDIRS
ncbi:hypothetical protein D3C81_2147670 [compost metagenome]